MWHEFIDTFILVELNLLLIHIFFRDAVLDLEKPLRGFPGGPGVKNPPANAGDMGLVLSPGRCHAAEQLSPRATAPEACAPRAHAPQEKPPQWEAVRCSWKVAPSRRS